MSLNHTPNMGAPPNPWWEPEESVARSIKCLRCGGTSGDGPWYMIRHNMRCPVQERKIRDDALAERKQLIDVVSGYIGVDKYAEFFKNPMTDEEYWARTDVSRHSTLTIKRTLPYERTRHFHHKQTATAHSEDGSTTGAAVYNPTSAYLKHCDDEQPFLSTDMSTYK